MGDNETQLLGNWLLQCIALSQLWLRLLKLITPVSVLKLSFFHRNRKWEYSDSCTEHLQMLPRLRNVTQEI